MKGGAVDSPHIFIAVTNPVEGKEAEYNEWYDHIHVPDVLRADGWVAAQRYRLTNEQRPDQSPPWKYLCVYEVNRPDGEILPAVSNRSKMIGPWASPQPALWADDSQVWIYSKFGPRILERPGD
jgi:hypothetical protein